MITSGFVPYFYFYGLNIEEFKFTLPNHQSFFSANITGYTVFTVQISFTTTSAINFVPVYDTTILYCTCFIFIVYLKSIKFAISFEFSPIPTINQINNLMLLFNLSFLPWRISVKNKNQCSTNSKRYHTHSTIIILSVLYFYHGMQ